MQFPIHTVRTCRHCENVFRCWQPYAFLCDGCRTKPNPAGQLALFPPRQVRGPAWATPLHPRPSQAVTRP